MFNYAKYLEAKIPVDERALNPLVWNAFVEILKKEERKQLKVLEAGGGIGATFCRLLDAGISRNIHYTLVDVEASNISYFNTHVNEWLYARGYTIRAGEWTWENKAGLSVEVSAQLKDINEFIDSNSLKWDALIAQAFLDLFDINTFVPRIVSLLEDTGVFYFPINFDGVTSFLPVLDVDLDQKVMDIYHDSMDARSDVPADKKRSLSGRYLLSEMVTSGLSILEAGGSDWLVYPKKVGYSTEERYFLEQILNFVKGELEDSEAIENEDREYWISQRFTQLNNQQLIYITHQLDVLGMR